MFRKSLILTMFMTAFSGLAYSESDFHLFPAVVDGRAADGTYYTSTLMVMPYDEDDAPECDFDLYGLSVQFEGTGFYSSYLLSIPADGSAVFRTTSTQALATGYAALTCDTEVYATLLYSYFAPNGVKLSEATVFSTEIPRDYYRLVVDQRDGAQLGIAIANDTDTSRTYDFFLVANGVERSGSLRVPGRSSESRFLNQLLNVPANAVGTLTIVSRDFSEFAAIGLRFTGAAFTTIPANW